MEMMVRRSKRASVPKAKYKDYWQVADNFHAGSEMAKAYEYWNAAGVLIVHSAIAYTDAITIKIGGVKSHGDDHMDAVDLLRSVVALDEKGKSAVNHLWRMIQEKNVVSYNGEIYTGDDVDKLWKHLERYRSWALNLLS
jgi:hypothetical protein